MTTFEFKSERNWLKVHDTLDEAKCNICSYGYKAITCFDGRAEALLKEICFNSKIAYIVSE